MSFAVILIQVMFGQPRVLTRMLAMSQPDVDNLCLSAKVSRVDGGKSRHFGSTFDQLLTRPVQFPSISYQWLVLEIGRIHSF